MTTDADTSANFPEDLEPASPAGDVVAEDAQAELSFADMLAAHEKEEAPHTRLSPGQRVSVRVVAITSDTVFVSTGSKVDGIVDREELLVDGQLPYQVGDSVELYVVTATAQEVKLSKIVSGSGSLVALEEARDAGLPVEGKVTAEVKGGFAIDIMKRRAFCPTSQMDMRPVDDPNFFLGKTLAFAITRLEKGGRNIVVSRRVLLEREQAENRDALLETLHEGDVVEATVTRLAPFGAFVELAPNVEGMVHISELSWARVAQADEAVSVGDRIRVKVLKIAVGEKNARISLSAKQVSDDPWKSAADRLHAGDVVSGKVIRTAPFGAFVEVLPGIEGLVHISELSFERRVTKTEEVVVAGDIVSVKIKDLDLEKRRLSLSIRDAVGNPWDTVMETLAVGLEVVGTMEKRAPFGFFVTLAPGITGLLPLSNIQGAKRREFEKLGTGEPAPVVIREIDALQRRITLGVIGGEDNMNTAEEKDWKKHAPKSAPVSAFGSLGLALQEAAASKKAKKK